LRNSGDAEGKAMEDEDRWGSRGHFIRGQKEKIILVECIIETQKYSAWL
jgi:hypothetical protein